MDKAAELIGGNVAASADNVATVLRLSILNVEALIYRLPVKADEAERKSLETWLGRLRAAAEIEGKR